MNPVISESAEMEAVCSRCLAGGLDTEKMDEFLDHIFSLAARLGGVECTLVNESTLRIQSGDALVHERTLPRATTKLRTICARLAVRCGAWSNREMSPYGDVVELRDATRPHTIRFKNTNDAVMFAVDDTLSVHPTTFLPQAPEDP